MSCPKCKGEDYLVPPLPVSFRKCKDCDVIFSTINEDGQFDLLLEKINAEYKAQSSVKMTHEELIWKLHKFEMNDCSENECAYNYKALLAVVELHKPTRIDGGFMDCQGCSQSPCPTIQAIEKELK